VGGHRIGTNTDDTRQEFHLTARGWIPGTLVDHGQVQGAIVDRPSDAVESWEEHVTQRSPYSETVSATTLLWASAQHTLQDREALRAKFRLPFAGLAVNPLERLTGDTVRTVEFRADSRTEPRRSLDDEE
jgi:hypothetical protein